jgi:DNA polymerase-1
VAQQLAMRAPGSAKLMLIDTYGLVYRAFFALPMLTTSHGVPINAAYGFTMMLTKIIADEKPTHVIAAFDKGLPTARIALYADYKAQRQATPDDLRSQFSLVRTILDAYAIPIVEVDGEEADDVIATLARQAEEAQQNVAVVTGDLDLLQIVDDRTIVLTTRRGITELGRYDAAAVHARFELEPRQLPDYRGLKGDPSDNLPGIPGVGEKTAIKLIKSAGSLDALLANPALAGSPKLEKLVVEYGEQARVCRDVSLIDRNLPIAIDWEHAAYVAPTNETLYRLYRELEFKTLLNRLEPPAVPVEIPVEERLDGRYTSFVAATDPLDFAKLADLIDAAAQSPRVALAVRGDAIGLSAADETAIDFLRSALDQPRIAAAFAGLWTTVPQLVVYDAKATIAALDLPPRVVADDPMIGAHVLNPSRAYTDVADATRELLRRELPPHDAAAAADAAGRLGRVTRAELEARDQLELYADVEVPLAVVLAKMERAGVKLDVDELRTLAVSVDADVSRLQDEIYIIAGETFNIGSPQQLGRILFDKLGLPAGRQNKTGYATGVEVLHGLARSFPVAAKVLEYREVSKLKNTYIDVLPTLVDPRDDRLHTIFNQTTTATGRLSSTNPNLQNIPVRSAVGRSGPARRRLLADRTAVDGTSLGRRGDARCISRASRHPRFHRAPDFRDRAVCRRHGQSAADGQVRQFRFALRDVGLRISPAAGNRSRRGAGDHDGLLRSIPGSTRVHRTLSRRRPRARLRVDAARPAALYAGSARQELRLACGGRTRSDERAAARQCCRPHEARDGAARSPDRSRRIWRRHDLADPRRTRLRDSTCRTRRIQPRREV